ncbi:fasciclin domain-containing protein [Leekyejoonella antrihumi]|uniref:Fasciclin domain-containing protein n=1 Tax=Leekyejoonella antrihumi TaxID=1660198 RepID=A0A563E1F3_9MICO|nr:fasciclin domain-containing protein [Leekyejoonella antrihumi]TWP36360.1 fasciclin domain-containing protein [Leekyejoonella antrihumi]
MNAKRIATTAALALTIPLGLAACGSSGSSGNSSSGSAASSAPSAMSSSSSSMSSGSAMNASKPFGPGCASVPKDGKGSFNGMAADPVATAASNNPLLSTLVTAVKKAGLVDTLNSSKSLTVFAPTNSAFAKLPKATLDKALGDKAMLTKILTGHVVSGRLTPMQLAGSHKSLAGNTIKVTGSGSSFKVDGTASVICGNVQTANATVYIIDSVLPSN